MLVPRRCALWLLLVVTVAAQTAERPLPLRRFLASRAAQTDAQGFYRFATAVGDDYFDGTDPEARVARHLRVARDLGVKYLRCAFSWNGIEPEPGRYQWAFWDQLVELASQNGITLIPYVAYTPRWAAAKPEEFWRQPPRDLRLYAEFMETIARRYRGRIHSWEIWNEPDLEAYWLGTPQQFAELVKLAAPRVRRADPDAVLVLGGMSRGPQAFLRELLRAHVERYVDVMAVHAYPESWHEARIEEVFAEVVAPMARLIAPGGEDLWLNEMGYPDYRLAPDQASIYGVHVYSRHEHTRDFQAVALFRMFTLALASRGLSLAGWYRIDDFPHSDTRPGTDFVNHHLGLLDVEGKPKPDYYAFQLFNRLFDAPAKPLEAAVRGCASQQCVVKVIARRDGGMSIVGWLRSPRYGERPATGEEIDRRRETVRVSVPCTEERDAVTYSVVGKPIVTGAKFLRGEVRGIPLKGDGVFISAFTCARD